ncbi:MAG: hydrogenase 4 subunit F [Thermoplasmata archaeon]|uniref:Hydrogenase 4 subunit F n=1 Tax=Candidatus Sysuiplasma superficiale TaxID=2823368 RepID=A0A8J8CA92_9ARCH|nr:hydrogenase 4 subunit F [Candidatus Sysuiplasma superficiale]MBX8643141.1 hydrogenase 4 subunit F [Candidatus Sysuiplasma superficiale]MCL4346927.1 hydrogenase 4 subunit F [Candidatus Thermoplasmatota archaeon]
MNLLVLLLIAIPAVSSLSYFSRSFRPLSAVAAFITLCIAAVINVFSISVSGFFLVNEMSRIIALTVSAVYLLSVIFALGYHHHLGESRNMRLHLSMMHLFASSMLFSLTVDNYGLLWIGIESTTITSALLLVIEENKLNLEAAWRYVVIVSSGLAISLISIIMIYKAFGTLDISVLLAEKHVYTPITEIAGATALIGFGTKIGIAPMHTWLPDAHSEAPSEISAMFSGVLLPVAAYALYRIYQVTGSPRMEALYIFFALITIATAALMMPSQRFYKRMFAYSTMENMAMIVIGLTIGGIGFTGAIVLLVSHAFGKAGAFYSSGNIISATGKKRIDEVKGLRDTMPQSWYVLLLSSLAVTGAPPSGTFIGVFLIFLGLADRGLLAVAAIIAVMMLVTFASVNMKVLSMTLSVGKDQAIQEAGRLQRAIAVSSVAMSTVVSVAFLIAGGI